MNQSSKDNQPKRDRKSILGGKPITYILSVAILAIIAVALIGGPALSGAARRGQVSFGTYDGEPITISPGNYFSRTYQNIASFYQRSGIEITDQVYFEVWQGAFYQTVFHMALMGYGNQAGAGISSEAVDRSIAQWPAFQVDGRFSAEEFQSMSSPDRLLLREYLEEVLVAEQVRSDLASSAVFSEAELEFLVDMGWPEKRFRYVEFSFDSFPDSEVAAYGALNVERFRRIRVSQITIDSSESDAASIRQQALDRTASFEDLARNQSEDEFADAGGERGWVYYWDLEFDFEDIALVDDLFSLEEGEVSEVYATGSRWRIYRIDEAPVNPDFEDAETLGEVRTYLTTFERGQIEDYLRVAADDFVAQAREQDFATAATSVNQLPLLTDYFPVNYGNVSLYPPVNAVANATVQNSAAYREEFLQDLFALEPGQVSEPIVVRDYVFVFELEDSRDGSDEQRSNLMATIPSGIEQIALSQSTEGVVDQDLLVDNFMQTYATAVLGQ